MTIRTIQRKGLEKFKSPAFIAGQSAEVAEVTRYYRVDTTTGEEVEYGTPDIVPIWGKTAADTIAELDQKKIETVERADAEVARYEELKVALSKADVKGDEVVVKE